MLMQIEDAFYFLPNPFPLGNIVGVVKQTLGLVDGSSRQVPLSEVHRHLSQYVLFSYIISLLTFELCHVIFTRHTFSCQIYVLLSSYVIFSPVKVMFSCHISSLV